MSEFGPPRPQLLRTLTSAEFERWYWLKTQLAEFARTLGLRATGGKLILTQRISAYLDGRELIEQPAQRNEAAVRLTQPLSSASTLPVGQRCSQILRVWFTEQIGASFRFDAEMRAYFANADGTQTLADAVQHWRLTRTAKRKPIGKQFELNRFTRAWFAEHPNGTQDELQLAWRVYRSLPVDLRGKVKTVSHSP